MFLAHVICSHWDIREILWHVSTYFSFTQWDRRQSHLAEDCTRQSAPPAELSRRVHGGPSQSSRHPPVPDVPSGLLYSHPFFILGRIMLLAEAQGRMSLTLLIVTTKDCLGWQEDTRCELNKPSAQRCQGESTVNNWLSDSASCWQTWVQRVQRQKYQVAKWWHTHTNTEGEKNCWVTTAPCSPHQVTVFPPVTWKRGP